ncbi:hypothetical protein RZN25_16400 [Bacillaceae bacterium S4-13-56]
MASEVDLMESKYLFLFGGSPPFTYTLGKRFADLALSSKGKVAILFLEREGWERYMEKYTSELEGNGGHDSVYLSLSQE